MRTVTNYHYYEELNLTIGEDGGKLSVIDWGRQIFAGTNQQTPLTDETYRQLCDYFAGRRKSFDLPLEVHGTEFEMAVWAELQKIPYGKTTTYTQIAQDLGDKEARQAVGMACNHNPIAIVIPCHRVIGADGSLVGYVGTLDAKKALLRLEQNNS
ncbi:MAG: methylated-DNA--[protein]-cysteine S-methyltransferase [Sphaerochaeta sp.]|jgi:methylated-DNA-[protein]-cysteine S-methyltransferase|nr:methylated-DNA--[protein]-cysteine S-methyltransferase [Sphaerochaeta sp.]